MGECVTDYSGEFGGLLPVVHPIDCCWIGICDLGVLNAAKWEISPRVPLNHPVEVVSEEEMD